jgi:hypothetical protein
VVVSLSPTPSLLSSCALPRPPTHYYNNLNLNSMEGWDLEGYEKQEKTFYQFEVYNLSFMSQVKSDRKAAQKQLSTQTTCALACRVSCRG